MAEPRIPTEEDLKAAGITRGPGRKPVASSADGPPPTPAPPPPPPPPPPPGSGEGQDFEPDRP